MITLFVALLAAQTPAAPPAAPPPAPARRAPAAATIEVRVTDRTGTPAASVHVSAEGAVGRDGMTDPAGVVSFRGLTPGVYRLRAEREGLVTLEKEVLLRTGGTSPIDMTLSIAPKVAEPPKPVAPPPPPVVVAPQPAVTAGDPKLVSLIELTEQSLDGKEPLRHVPIGCSGVSRAQLLIVRDALQAGAVPDADDMLYVFAGEGSITLAGKTQAVSPGWFGLVPRGVTRSAVKRGRNPLILLSILGGPACTAASTP